MVAFSFGVVFGLPVVYVMISNGIHLGGVFGLTQAYGLSGGLFEFVIGHGVLGSCRSSWPRARPA